MSFLDDMLRYEDDEPATHPQARRGVSYRWLVQPALVSLAGAVVGGLVLRASGLAVPYPLIFMVLLAVQLVRRALRWLDPRPVPPGLRRGADPPPTTSWDGLRAATSRWESRLSWMRLQREAGQFARSVQPQIVALVDERLRLRHGVVREADPDRARQLVGEPLWRFLTVPFERAPSPRDLGELIDRIEAL